MDLGVAGDLATVEARVTGLRVSRLGVEQARAVSIAATVTTRHLRMAHAFDDAQFSLAAGGVETDDVGAWKELSPVHVARSRSVGHGDRAGSRPRLALRWVGRR